MDSAGSRILVVDDEPALLDLMKIYLSRLGYAVNTSDSTEHAWQTFAESPGEFAVAVVDGTMEGDGLQDLAARMLAANSSMGVIACSGYPVDMSAIKAAAPGRVGFLPKPFTPDELTEAVRGMLAQKKEDI